MLNFFHLYPQLRELCLVYINKLLFNEGTPLFRIITGESANAWSEKIIIFSLYAALKIKIKLKRDKSQSSFQTSKHCGGDSEASREY